MTCPTSEQTWALLQPTLPNVLTSYDIFPQKGDSLHRTLNHLCLPQLHCKMYESKQLHLCAVSLVIESICSSYAMLPQHLACLFTPVSSTQSLLTFGWTVCWLLFFSAWQIRSSEDSNSWLKAKSSMSLRQACHHRSAAAWDKAIHGADRRWESCWSPPCF